MMLILRRRILLGGSGLPAGRLTSSNQVPNRTTPSRRLGGENTSEDSTTPMLCPAGNTNRLDES